MITGPISNNNAGMAAFSRFATANTWPAAQTFSVAATFSAGFTSTGLLQSTSSSTTVGGVLSRANGTISANPAGIANTAFQAIGAEAVVGYSIFDAAASNAQVLLRRRNGTYASQTAIASGNNLGSVAWQGFGASTFGTVPAAEIRGVAQQAFTETARGTALEFYVTANNTITQQLTLTIFPTLVGCTVPIQAVDYSLTKTAGNARTISFQTSTSNRWALIANATAEGGSNAGSNFEFRRYSDAAADLGLVMAVTRSTGDITFNGGGGKTTFAANAINISTTQSPATSAAAGTTGDIAWDDTYLYVRMSTGWRRIALGAAF